MIQVPEDIKQFTEPNTLLYHKFFSTDAVADELEVNVFNKLSLLSESARRAYLIHVISSLMTKLHFYAIKYEFLCEE